MNAATATIAAGPQHLRALERANRVRLARAELKRRVGSQTLAVRPTDVGRLADVEAILRDVAGGATPTRPDDRSSAVPVADDRVLVPVVARLDEAGIAVEELGLRLPCLDEAFDVLSNRTHEEVAA